MPMLTASNDPRPSGIGPRVTTIDAIMNGTNAVVKDAFTPSANRHSCMVRPSASHTAPFNAVTCAIRRGLRTRWLGASLISSSSSRMFSNRFTQFGIFARLFRCSQRAVPGIAVATASSRPASPSTIIGTPSRSHIRITAAIAAIA